MSESGTGERATVDSLDGVAIPAGPERNIGGTTTP